jgi:hypothetical protein
LTLEKTTIAKIKKRDNNQGRKAHFATGEWEWSVLSSWYWALAVSGKGRFSDGNGVVLEVLEGDGWSIESVPSI